MCLSELLHALARCACLLPPDGVRMAVMPNPCPACLAATHRPPRIAEDPGVQQQLWELWQQQTGDTIQ